MVFSSLTFLFVFLPAVLFVYWAVRGTAARNAVLLVASLVFYAWGEGAYVLVMLGSLVVNWGGGVLLGRLAGRPHARAVLALFVLLDLALLGAFKYAGFLAHNVSVLAARLGLDVAFELEPVHLPIGISFFTFQAVSYLVDVYRKDAPVGRNPLDVALYIAMFPQLVAGPIVRYRDVAAQLVERVVGREDFALGVRRFAIGLGKKVLVANVLGRTADDVFALSAESVGTSLAWLGIVCYALQIYFDFSGYSDMAIGLGRMLGFRFLENFRYPYVAQSIADFWRRWHISLSTWFRDYLYIPLGGNRRSPARVYANLVTVFALCGLWHGASWNFVLWGLLHGAFLVLERVGLGALLARVWRPLRHAYVLVVVLVGWAFFRIESLPGAASLVASLFGAGGADALPIAEVLDREVVVTLVVALVASLPIAPWLAERCAARVAPRPLLDPLAAVLRLTGVAALLVVSATYLVSDTYNPFIYFRF